MAERDHQALVNGRDLPVSTKHAIEISSALRGKNLHKSLEFLGRVIRKEAAVPFRRFRRSIAHKAPHVGSGRYPVKAAQEITKLLKSVEANAQNKGLNTDALYIAEIVSNMASRPYHMGRWRRRLMKRTHVKIVVEEREAPQQKEKVPAKKKAPEEKGGKA